MALPFMSLDGDPAGPRRDRPRPFNTVIGTVLAAGAAAFVLLLAGFGSGLLTEDEPDLGSSLYESGPGEAIDTAGGDEGAVSGPAAFAITRVEFGEAGYVEIRNVGGSPGGFSGWFLCQRPSYGSFDAPELAPGQAVWVTGGGADALTPPGDVVAVVPGIGFGALDAADGEIGLYSGSSFGDAAAIVSYVEWGSAGHGRSSVAVSAGIWDGSVVPGGGRAIATAGTATSAGEWSGG